MALKNRADYDELAYSKGFRFLGPVPGNTKTKTNWECGRDHKWVASFASVARGGCPNCAGNARKTERDYQEIGKSRDIAWVGESLPARVTDKTKWRCPKGHVWITRYNAIQTGQNCAVCHGQQVSPETSLATLYPELAKQWHPTKNGNLTPSDVVVGRGARVWWHCARCGEDWRVRIIDRVNYKTGCPYCRELKVAPSNSLATKHPRIAAEWHPTRNADLTPERVTGSSTKKAWWRCKFGHEWETRIKLRTGPRPTGCPTCSNQTSRIELRVFSELAQFFPDAVRRVRIRQDEIDIYLPSHRIGIEVDGHRWHKSNTMRDRAKGERVARNGITLMRLRERPLRRIGSLDVLFDRREYDQPGDACFNCARAICKLIAEPTELTERIEKYADARRLVGADEYHRLLGTQSPPVQRSLAVVAPTIAAEWDSERNAPLTPHDVLAFTTRKVWWRCAKGHPAYQQAIHVRASGHSSCPYCIGRIVLPEASFGTALKGSKILWHPTRNGSLDPFSLWPTSTTKVWFKCTTCGHEWRTSPQHIVSSGSGCPPCNYKRGAETAAASRRRRHGSLASRAPGIAQLWHPTRNKALNPDDVSRFSERSYWWRCARCGEQWTVSPMRFRGCPTCRYGAE